MKGSYCDNVVIHWHTQDYGGVLAIGSYPPHGKILCGELCTQ